MTIRDRLRDENRASLWLAWAVVIALGVAGGCAMMRLITVWPASGVMDGREP